MAMRLQSLRSSRGFSLLEALVGAVFLIVIVQGTLILITRSVINNESGATYTDLANIARTQIEEMNQVPFNGVELTIAAGSENLFERYYSANDERWIDGPPPVDGTDAALWTSATSVRQYNNSAWEDGVLEQDEALASDTPSEFVHLKEVIVLVTSGERPGMLGPQRRVSLRTLISK